MNLVEYWDALDDARGEYAGRSRAEWRSLAIERGRSLDRFIEERRGYYKALDGALALLRQVHYDPRTDRYYLDPVSVMNENANAREVWKRIRVGR